MNVLFGMGARLVLPLTALGLLHSPSLSLQEGGVRLGLGTAKLRWGC